MSDNRLVSSSKGKDFWGPTVWTWEHIIAYSLRPESAECYIKQWHILARVLPCDVCRENLKAKFNVLNVRAYVSQGATGAFVLSYIIHDMANKHITQYTRNTKISPSYDMVLATYTHEMSKGYEFWGPYLWGTIHSIGATIKPVDGPYFLAFLACCAKLMPKYGDILASILLSKPGNLYMGSNEDAFFYTYLIHKQFDAYLGLQTVSLEKLKGLYFKSLSDECSTCKLDS